MSKPHDHNGRVVQAPVSRTLPNGTVVSSHPAYSQITISRVSGSANLYGSDFSHMGFIRIKVFPSELHQSSSDLRASSSLRPHLELDMSEAQWSTALSSMNMGEGVQCTLRRLGDQVLPELPEAPPRNDAFRVELRSRMEEARATLQELSEQINASGLSKSRQVEMLRKVQMAQTQITANLEHVSSLFDEHIEESTQKAAMEVNGYVAGVVRAAGLEALAANPHGALASLGMSQRTPGAGEDEQAASGPAPSGG